VDQRAKRAAQIRAARSKLKKRGCMWLYVESYIEAVPRFFGDNHGALPSRLKMTEIEPYRSARKSQGEDALHGRKIGQVWLILNREDGNLIISRANSFFTDQDVALNGRWHDIHPKRMRDLVEWAATATDTELIREQDLWASMFAEMKKAA